MIWSQNSTSFKVTSVTPGSAVPNSKIRMTVAGTRNAAYVFPATPYVTLVKTDGAGNHLVTVVGATLLFNAGDAFAPNWTLVADVVLPEGSLGDYQVVVRVNDEHAVGDAGSPNGLFRVL